MTVLKIGSIVALVLLGFLVPAKSALGLTAPLPSIEGSLLAAFGVAMIAVLWTYDGWYGLVFSAGEMRDPARGLPRGLIGGTALVLALYLAANLVYLRALPIATMAAEARVGEAAAAALFGEIGGRLLSAAVVVSSFGCLAATILYSSRIYHPMAADGVFFRGLAKIDPTHHVPQRSLWWQSLWAVLLTLSGTYSQLFTYVVFGAVLFHALAGAAVMVLRRKAPAHPRPYRVWGYPIVPILFIAASLLIVVNTAIERPVESLLGVGIILLGVPAYLYWRRSRAA
jgi:APA family basic amino acid/polyamine antiporter